MYLNETYFATMFNIDGIFSERNEKNDKGFFMFTIRYLKRTKNGNIEKKMVFQGTSKMYEKIKHIKDGDPIVVDFEITTKENKHGVIYNNLLAVAITEL